MWVRSKLNSKLINCNGFEVEISLKGYDVMGFSGNQAIKLGEYESKARALEILDEIESTLRVGYSYDSMKGNHRYFREIIYKMPEE